jgi:serine/threonine-protein kinase
MSAESSVPDSPGYGLAATLDESSPEANSELLRPSPKPVVSAGNPLAEPSRIGRYLVLRCIGQGGMGVVYLAYDAELDRRVALKLVQSSRTNDTQGRSRVKQEAQTLAQVSHPNIVHVYEVGESAGQVFIAMEYVAGVPLSVWRSQLDTSPMAIQQILKVYLQAAAGLQAAHLANLIHRDFKPDNVLVDKEGRARVLDFGIARALDRGQAELEVAQHFEAPPPSSSQERLTQAGSCPGAERSRSSSYKGIRSACRAVGREPSGTGPRRRGSFRFLLHYSGGSDLRAPL